MKVVDGEDPRKRVLWVPEECPGGAPGCPARQVVQRGGPLHVRAKWSRKETPGRRLAAAPNWDRQSGYCTVRQRRVPTGFLFLWRGYGVMGFGFN